MRKRYRTGLLAWLHFLLAALIVLLGQKANALRTPYDSSGWQACQERRPPPFVRVEADAASTPRYQHDSSTALRLRTQGQAMVSKGDVLGLTSAQFSAVVRVGIHLQPLPDGKNCALTSYDVQLALEQFQVFLASELERDTCAHDYVMSHEALHVLFYREALKKTEVALREDLLQSAVNYQVDGESALPGLKARLSDIVGRHALDLFDRFNVQHASIDTAEQYARTKHVCGGAIPKLLGRAAMPRNR